MLSQAQLLTNSCMCGELWKRLAKFDTQMDLKFQVHITTVNFPFLSRNIPLGERCCSYTMILDTAIHVWLIDFCHKSGLRNHWSVLLHMNLSLGFVDTLFDC